MSLSYVLPEFIITRDNERCINCRVCQRQCSYGAQLWDDNKKKVYSDESKCVNCHRCVVFCPVNALSIQKNPSRLRENYNWTQEDVRNIHRQAETGGVLLSGMGSPRQLPVIWDKLLLNASQVTNPSIDPLREPMELDTYLGRKPVQVKLTSQGRLAEKLPPQLHLSIPIMFGAVSFGAVSLNVVKSLAMAAEKAGICCNTGEGGLHKELYPYGSSTIVQVASGRFGVDLDYLQAGAAIEIKIGQGAKPGIGGHLPGEKVNEEVARTRMIPLGTDALSPAPHHDIYSIEDLRQLIFALKEATDYQKPVSVKISAVHNAAAIASGIVRAGADIIAIDGFRGGTGAAPMRIRDNVGIPIELALAAVDRRLRQEGIRNQVSLVAAGSIRSSADVLKAVALGADAVYIVTAGLIALGCHLCGRCYTGRCSWGIATQDPQLVRRINPDIAVERLINLLRGWEHEMKEMLGGMGINAIESLRGNREMLRGIGLEKKELEVLDVKAAGE